MGCAPTTIQTEQQYTGTTPPPKPDRLLVYNFAVSPDEVQLDRGIGPRILDLVEGSPRTQEEVEVGHKVADAVTKYLVQAIRKMGLPAQRATGYPPTGGITVMIDGQFLSIDEGNRTRRVVIGLGAGRSEVETNVQVKEATTQGVRVLEEFRVTAKSGHKPGMAETMGAGAAAGRLATAGAMSTASAVGGETLPFGASVEADARRTADAISKRLKRFFASQGWIASPSSS